MVLVENAAGKTKRLLLKPVNLKLLGDAASIESGEQGRLRKRAFQVVLGVNRARSQVIEYFDLAPCKARGGFHIRTNGRGRRWFRGGGAVERGANFGDV